MVPVVVGVNGRWQWDESNFLQVQESDRKTFYSITPGFQVSSYSKILKQYGQRVASFKLFKRFSFLVPSFDDLVELLTVSWYISFHFNVNKRRKRVKKGRKMGQSLIKRDRVMRIEAHSPRLMPKILFVILLLLPNVCIGNPIELTNSSPPVPAHLVEIAGIIAYYEEGENYRDLGIVINEYEHDKSSPVLESTRGGSAAAEASDDRRRIVRQSVCYDVKMEIEEPEDLEIVSRKVCIYHD